MRPNSLFADVSFGCIKKCTLGSRLGSLLAPRAHQTIDRWRWQTRIWAAWAEVHMQKMRYFAYFNRFFTWKWNHIVMLLHIKSPFIIGFLSFLQVLSFEHVLWNIYVAGKPDVGRFHTIFSLLNLFFNFKRILGMSSFELQSILSSRAAKN